MEKNVSKLSILLLTILFFSSNSNAFLQIRKKEAQTLDINVSKPIIGNNKMVIFTNSIDNSEDVDIAKSNSGVFGANEMGVFYADNIFVNQKNKIMHMKKNVRMRTNQSILIYGNEATFDQNTKKLNMDDAHVFLYDNSSMLAKHLMQNSDNEYEMKDVHFSVCELKSFSELDTERNRKPEEYLEEKNILSPSKLDTFKNDKTYQDVEKQYQFIPWSVKADSLVMKKEERELTMKNVKFKLFGMSVFKMTEYKTKLDKEAKNGFLPPQMIMLGTRQIGLGLPYYTRLSSQTDLIVTPTFYTPISQFTGKKSNPAATMDQRRIRENTLGFKLRHLFYEANEERSEGLLKFSGLVSDNTGLINPYTRTYKKDENGNTITGNRWKIDLDADFGISKDTYVKGKFLKTSDPNFMPIYELKFEPYSRNFAGITKVNKDSYNSAEIMEFQPLLIYTSPQTSPLAIQLRSVFEKKLENILGGRFLLDQRFVNLQRQAGYDSRIYNLNLGYSLPIRTKSDIYIHSNASLLLDSQSSKYSQIPDSRYGKVSSYYASTNTAIYSNENSRMAYNGLNYGGINYDNTRRYYNLSIDVAKPIFTGFGRFGQVVIEPRFTYKQSPNLNMKQMILEDSLGTEMQSTNLYASNLSSGYGVIDSGKRISYGVNMYSKLGFSDLTFAASGGVLTYIGAQNPMFAEYNGFSGQFSNYVGNVKIYNNSFSLQHDYTVKSDNPESLLGAITAPYSHRTKLSITTIEGLTITGAYNKFRSDPFGYLGSITSFSPSIIYSFKNGLSIGIMGVLITNKGDDNSIAATSTWLRQGFSILKQTNCIFYGLNYFKNSYAIPGVSQEPIIRFNFGVTGI